MKLRWEECEPYVSPLRALWVWYDGNFSPVVSNFRHYDKGLLAAC